MEHFHGKEHPLKREVQGDALLQKRFTVDYLTKKQKKNEGEIPQYYVEGNHEAIIPPEKFDMVQWEMAKRGKGKKYHSGVHPFSSKVRCGECGSWYGSKVWHSTDKYRRGIWQCNHKYDGGKHCSTPHLTDEQIQDAFLSAANKLLDEAQVVSDAVQQHIYENAHVALDQATYNEKHDALTAWYNSLKERMTGFKRHRHKRPALTISLEPLRQCRKP